MIYVVIGTPLRTGSSSNDFPDLCAVVAIVHDLKRVNHAVGSRDE